MSVEANSFTLNEANLSSPFNCSLSGNCSVNDVKSDIIIDGKAVQAGFCLLYTVIFVLGEIQF